VSAGAGRHVPLIDLTRLDSGLFEEAEATFSRVARAGAFTLGEDLESFEAEFAAYCGHGFCVGVADGTAALRLALSALGAGPGREVVTVPLTFVATVEAIAMTGARPVLVDVDERTGCIDPAQVAAAVGPRTAAVVPVHLYGRPAPMDELREAAGPVPLVVDAAQAHGAEFGGTRTGALGDVATFSFYPTKNLGAMGDGGAVVTGDGDVAAAVRSLRHHGAAPDDSNRHLLRGTTARLDNLQAAILRLKLPHLDAWNEQRREAAALYREALAGLPIELPPEDLPGARQVFHVFRVGAPERDRVLAELRRAGIGAAVHYPTPVHLQPAWSELGYGEGALPASERAAERSLSLPLFPGIAREEVQRVSEALRSALA
jgi:dTDP-4-amino-4,6-dideoxygalactose transaminase